MEVRLILIFRMFASVGPTCCQSCFLPGVSKLTDSSGAERSGNLAGGVFSPNRDARIINLCFTFAADRRRHPGGFSASRRLILSAIGWQKKEGLPLGRRRRTCQFSHSVHSTRFRESLIS